MATFDAKCSITEQALGAQSTAIFVLSACWCCYDYESHDREGGVSAQKQPSQVVMEEQLHRRRIPECYLRLRDGCGAVLQSPKLEIPKHLYVLRHQRKQFGLLTEDSVRSNTHRRNYRCAIYHGL